MTKVGQVGPNGYSWILRCLSPKYTNLTAWVNTTVSTHCHCVNFLVRNKQTRCSLAVLLETVWFIHWLIKLSLPSIPWWKYLQNIITPKPLELGTWSFGTIFIPLVCQVSHITFHMSYDIISPKLLELGIWNCETMLNMPHHVKQPVSVWSQVCCRKAIHALLDQLTSFGQRESLTIHASSGSGQMSAVCSAQSVKMVQSVAARWHCSKWFVNWEF